MSQLSRHGKAHGYAHSPSPFPLSFQYQVLSTYLGARAPRDWDWSK